MVSPSIADLRRAFYGSEDDESVTDAEYEALLALRARGLNITNIADRLSFPQMEPAINRWSEKFSLMRVGGGGALSLDLLLIGDSRVLSSASHYRKSWPFLLRQKLMGKRRGSFGLLSASAGALSGVTNGDWVGGDNPWTYTGAVGGRSDFGVGFHSAEVPTAGTATITYFGDKISLRYVRTATGPTAATVTWDGTSVGPLNANGTESAGLMVTYGNNEFGFHTLVVTPNNGPLIIEGVEWYDTDIPFFNVNSIKLNLGEHAGFGAKDWAGANNNWSASLTGGDAFTGIGVICLDVNDIGAGRTPAQYKADLKTIVSRVDTRLSSTSLSWMFITLPTNQDVTAYRDAAYEAASDIGINRAIVYDMGGLRPPSRAWGTVLSGDGSHLTDAGHIWVAALLGEVLDPTNSAGPIPIYPLSRRYDIDSRTPTDHRISWTEAFTQIGYGGYDQSGGGTTQGQRIHALWLDEGTYRATITMQEDTALGTVEVLLGRWDNNTPTLTSMGTKANAAATPTLVTTTLATSVTTSLAGWHPIYIRKTTAAGAIRFVKLVLDKTA